MMCLDGHTSTLAACDGAGACVVDPERATCAAGYHCVDYLGCPTRCGSDDECDAPAYRCDTSTSTCVANNDGGVD
jgi:hypothetical protein